MGKIRIILCISLFSIFVFSISYATKPQKPSLNMDMKLEFSGPVEIDNEVTVTFTFTPLQDFKRHSTLDDMAEIKFDTNMIKLISGNPQWKGKLQIGRTEKIIIGVKPVKFDRAGYVSFLGNVNSGQTDPSKIAQELRDQLPPEGVFVYRNAVRKEFKLGEPKIVEHVDSVVLEGATVIKSIRSLGPPPIITEGRNVRIVPPESAIYSDSIKRDTIYRPH